MLRFTFSVIVMIHASVGFLSKNCKDIQRHPNLKLLGPSSECGAVAMQPRIMGGKEANLGEYPWMALILAKDDRLTMRLCGGGLISDKYVLTAAHCIDQYDRANIIKQPGDVYQLVVRLGEHDLFTDPDTRRGVTAPLSVEYEVETWLVHEQYKSSGSFYNDIALFRLKDKVRLNDFVNTICLPITCKLIMNDLAGKRVLLAGWGSLFDRPKVSTRTLQKVYSHVVDSDKECAATMIKGRRFPTVDSQLCAGGSSEERGEGDACSGDSGGPLMYINFDEGFPKTYQVGIVSAGEPCSKNSSRSPGLYTRVSYFMPWILDNMKP